jgi:anti-anti-sigma factor
MVRGECDITMAPVLREQLLGLLARQSATMVLDLSGLDFVDCAGARVLLATGRRAALLGGTMVIAAPTPPVARLLRLTGLDRQLTVFPTAGAALAAVRPGGQMPAQGDRSASPAATSAPRQCRHAADAPRPEHIEARAVPAGS